MPPPRLLAGSRRSAQTQNSTGGARPTLPPYEPRSQPLNEVGKHALSELARTHETRTYNEHLTQSASHLCDTVGAINDILISRRRFLANMTEKREKRGEERKSELESQLEEEVASLESDVKELTERAEAAIRDVIDARAELEDEVRVLQRVTQAAAAQQPRREQIKTERGSGGRRRRQQRDNGGISDEDEEQSDEDMLDAEQQDQQEEDPPIAGLTELLETTRRAARDEYDALTVQQRYGKNNDYISFKKTWHDSVHQDDQMPVPDVSTWFDAQGRAVQSVGPAGDDDEVVIEREVIDFRCPLTMALLKEPYSNRKCKHTHEKSAVLQFLRENRGVIKCAVCTTELREQDFFLDEFLLRKIKRAREAEQRQRDDDDDDEEGDEDDEDEDDADQSIIPGRSVNVKRERASRGPGSSRQQQQRRRIVEDIEDGESE
ncbi:E3 SUMO-protein ligase nse2 [Echria macrotheca]|uniref:E3 SUMO-protein ligase nse2 n=1 Tax=Echria macrotheca TaxID=438768 RepID=A0AAJ0BJN0_9PEZI|nr:E3 SUMO-protein ligase nse2 [Echria macrotheca]